MYWEISSIEASYKDIIIEALSHMQADLAGLAACILDDPELERMGLLDSISGKQAIIARALYALRGDCVHREVGHGLF